MASEADIETLMALVGSINREESQALLNRNNYDVEKAINFFYDDPTTALQSITTNWTDPPPYASINDREFQSYNIHAPDVNQPGGGRATAPSRPPSRISTHGDIQDLTELHAAADPNDRFTEKEKNDPLVQQERQRLSGLSYIEGQTTGVTRSGQNFRKVPNDRSDTDQWIMTTSSAVIPDIPPEYRRRRPNEPAFLRSPGDDSYLGPLLTIYHSIPLAKEALLFKRFPKRDSDYGMEPQWWNGETVVQVRIIDDGGDDEDTANAYDVVHESQRLMAFLDNTERAFGSTAPLSRMAYLAGISIDPRDPFSDSDIYRLLRFWRRSLNNSKTIDDPADFETVFESRAIKKGLDRPGEPPETKTFNFFGNPDITTGQGESLYDELDATIWKDHVDQPLDDVWIDELAEVVTFRFGRENRKGEGLDIPAVWYPDRYLNDDRPAARKMREQKLSAMREVQAIDESKRKLVTHRLNGEERDVKADLLAAVEAAKITSRATQKDGIIEESGENVNGTTKVPLAEADACIAELEAMIERIDQKAQLLDKQSQAVIDSIKQNAHAAALAADAPDAPRKHKYTLRGVSTHPHVTYLLNPMNGEESGNEPGDYQWYRISYSVEDGQEQRKQIAKEAAKKAMKSAGTNLQQGWESLKSSEEIPGYTIRTVSEDFVLSAARNESKSVLLVYASEKAVTHKSNGVAYNTPLQHFVGHDNRSFASELRGLDPLHTEFSPSFDPLPRTAGTGSSHTLSNNPFSPADGETEPLINPMQDRQESVVQSRASSTTLQSGSNSIIRSEEGQASPKRMKGYDDRIPTTLMQESEMDEMMVSSPRRLEMQEKAGTGLLGLGAAGAIAKAAAQSPKRQEDDSDMDVSSTHVEFADR